MKRGIRSHYLVIFLICLLFSFTSRVTAIEHGVAAREIVNWQALPAAFSKLPGAVSQSVSMQSLVRYWRNFEFSDMKLKTALEFSHLYSQSSINSGFSGKPAADNKAFHTSANLFDRDHNSIDFEIERFELNFTSGNFDIQIGRQPVSLGTSHFISVLDVVAPFHPGYLDSSYKPGVDAIRVRTQTGETGEMELIGIGARNNSDGTIIGRYRNTFSEFDVEIVSGQFKKRKFFGLGWEGERKKINIWGETALFERKNTLDANLGGFSSNMAFSAITGLEKDLGKDWRGGISFFHQDFGANNSRELQTAYASLPFQQGWMHLGGKSYFLVNASRKMNALANLNVNGMVNLNDNSTLWQPVLNISTGNESDIAFHAWVKTGKTPDNSPAGIISNSEFGSFSTGVGFIYRRYF